MITLDDIRKNFEEKDWPYEDRENYLVVQNPTAGDERVDAVVFISCDDDFFGVECFLPNLLNINLNETVLKALNSLNQKYRFFQFCLEESEGRHRLDMQYCIPVAYISNPEIAAEMLIRSLQIMDDAYAEIMKAKWAQ